MNKGKYLQETAIKIPIFSGKDGKKIAEIENYKKAFFSADETGDTIYCNVMNQV